MREIKVKVSFNSGRLHNQSSYVKTGDFNLTKMVFDFDVDYGRKYLKIASEQGELIYYDEIINNEVILVGKMVVKALHDNVVYTKYLDKETETNIFWYDPLTNKLYDDEYQEILEFDLEDYEKQYAQGSLFSEEGYYPFEVALYNDQGRITSVDSSLYASKEIIKVDDVYVIDKLPIIDTLIIGYNKAMQDMENAIKDLIDSKEEAETLINNFEADVEGYTNDFNTNATNKTSAFNQNATEKTTALNEIYEDAVDLKEEYDQDVADATSTLNGIVSSAESTYQAFDTNASEKLSAYNSNASSKLQDYNTNASSKESAYNSNATEKTTAFDNNASSKTTDFNTNATNKLDSYNSNATEKLQDYNDNAEEKVADFDEHVDSIQEEQVIQNKKIATLETVYNALPKVTGEGTDITLNGTANTKMELELEPSELEQKTTTGKNLFKLPESATKNGITFTKNSDGTFNISGTSTGSASFQIMINEVLTSGIYTLSLNTNLLKVYIQAYQNNNWVANLISLENVSKVTRTISSQGNQTNFLIDIPSGTTLNLQNVKIQLESDSEETNWEPYTGNQPAPSPSYPQDIHVISGDNTIKVSNSDNTQEQSLPLNLPVENLFDINSAEVDKALMWTNGNYFSDVGSIASDFIKVEYGKTYISNYYLQVILFDENKQYVKQYDGVNSGFKVFTIDSNNNAKYVKICFYKTVNNNIDFKTKNDLQLEKSTKVNSYTPFGTTPIEYCKIGDYEDEFVIPMNNLLPNYRSPMTTYGGITYTPNNDGSVKVNGTATSYSRYIDSDSFTLPAGTYYLYNSFDSSNIYSEIRNSDNSIIVNTNTHTQFTITETTSFTFRIYLSSGITVNTTIYPMITKKEVNIYEPYNDGKWYLKKNIGKVVLDGSESGWNDNDIADTANYYSYYLTAPSNIVELANQIKRLLYSNYFNETTWYDILNKINDTSAIALRGNKRFYFRTSQSTLNDFKNWLSTHNTEVYYPLASPEYILLNNTLQSQLDTIYEYVLAYQEQTNISQVNNDLPFNIKASAVRDISTMFDTITNAILEIGGE